MPKEWELTMHKKKFDEHRRRVRESKATIDNCKPKELPYSVKREIERQRYLESVEKGNRLLLDRLGKAMETKNIDNENRGLQFPSLIQGAQKKEAMRIQAENHRLLGKIRTTEPVHRRLEWERDAEAREVYLKNLTEYPHRFNRTFEPSKKLMDAKERYLQSIGKSSQEAESRTPVMNSTDEVS